MKPKITIDRHAIRFENDEGGRNFFFQDLFRFPNQDWHKEVLEEIYRFYEECVEKNIHPKKEE